MITFECGSLSGCQKLEEIKTIMKMRKIERPIRVNKNIAKGLIAQSYIAQVENKNNQSQTYCLTSRGRTSKLFFEQFPFSLDSYLRIDDVQGWISRATRKRKFVFKIMITTCFSCGKDKERHDLEHVVDESGNDGMYCSSCLGKGYEHALNQLKERKDASSKKVSGSAEGNTTSNKVPAI